MFDINVRMRDGSIAENADARERLIKAAEKLFAEKGFNGVSVREITNAACTHLSAVNYHFGSKEGLYLAVYQTRFLERARRLRNAFTQRLKAYELSPGNIIRALAEAVVLGPLSEEERLIHYHLLVREITSPTKAFDLIVKEGIRPFVALVEEALRPHFKDVPPQRLRLAVLSIFAQVLYFNFARPKIEASTERTYDHSFKKELVEHIVLFSLKGLKGLWP